MDLIVPDDIFLLAGPVIEPDRQGGRLEGTLDEIPIDEDFEARLVRRHPGLFEKNPGLGVLNKNAVSSEEEDGLVDDLFNEGTAEQLRPWAAGCES
jgi:hypothetical protein